MRRFGEYEFVASVRDALPMSFVVLLAALALFLFLIPMPGPFFGPTLGTRISKALLPAFGAMAPALVLALSIVYARKAQLPYVPIVAAAVAGFALSLPPLTGGVIVFLGQLGTTGLFLALVVCGGVAGGVAIVQRTGVKGAVWIGAAAAAACFGALAAAHISLLFGIRDVLLPLAHLGDTYVALVVIVTVEMILWTAGIHGPATLAAIVTPIYLTLQAQNTDAFSRHAPLPHIVVVSLFLFVFPGGSGSTLPLAVMLALSRIARLRTVGRVAMLPGLFNINEPLMFGAPIVFNPYLAIPYVLVPLILCTTTYIAVASGLVARPAFYVPSMTPTLIGAYLATLDVRAIALIAINIAISAIIYFPFFRAYERHLEQES